MYRILFFLASILVPAVFSFWLFVPILIAYIFLVKSPYELLISGAVMDSLYYFGDGFAWKHIFSMISLAVLVLTLFLESRLSLKKIT